MNHPARNWPLVVVGFLFAAFFWLVAFVVKAHGQTVDSALIARLWETRHIPIEAATLGHVKCTPLGPQAFVNIEIIGKDSLLETVIHEMVHVNQQKKWGGFGCPYIARWELIDWEIQAYCSERPIRMRRTRRGKDEADGVYLLGLQLAFGGDSAMTAYLRRRYRDRCP